MPSRARPAGAGDGGGERDRVQRHVQHDPGGRDPDVTVSTSFQSSPSSDDVKDLIVRFPPACSATRPPRPSARRPSSRPTPARPAPPSGRSRSPRDTATTDGVVSQGTVYNLPPIGAEPARLGIKVRPAPIGPVVIEKISLIAVAKLGPETGYALETTIPNQPRTANSTTGPVALRVTKVDLTLRGKPGAKDFMINPSSCAPGTATTRVVPYDSGSRSSRSCAGHGPLRARPAIRPARVDGTMSHAVPPARDHCATPSCCCPPTRQRRDLVPGTPVGIAADSHRIGGSGFAAARHAADRWCSRRARRARCPSGALKGAAPLTLSARPTSWATACNTFPGAPDVPLSRFTPG